MSNRDLRPFSVTIDTRPDATERFMPAHVAGVKSSKAAAVIRELVQTGVIPAGVYRRGLDGEVMNAQGGGTNIVTFSHDNGLTRVRVRDLRPIPSNKAE